jgi:hypothetical protein
MDRIFGKIVYIIITGLLIAIAVSSADSRPGPCPICGHERHMEGMQHQTKAP